MVLAGLGVTVGNPMVLEASVVEETVVDTGDEEVVI
jgi:hypothetical protein